MITPKQLESLYQIINTKQQNLEKVNDKFIKYFGSDSYNLFRPCYCLNNLLNLNVYHFIIKLLTKTQRIMTIFLLFESFKVQGIKKNPFAYSLFEIFDKSSQQYQKKFIVQLLIQNKRDKYAKMKLDLLLQEYELYQDTYKKPEQIQNLKKAFIQNTPKISATALTEIKNIITDFNIVDKKSNLIQIAISKQNIKENQLNSTAYNSNFLRPLPKMIQIEASQLIWVSPGMIYDVCWDNSIEKAEKEKRISKINHYVKKAETTPLTSEQAKQTIKILDQQPHLIFQIDLTPNSLCEIVIKNPYIAFQLICRLNGSKKFQDYLQKLIDIQLHINSLDVMSKCFQQCEINNEMIQQYINLTMEKCIQIEAVGNQQKFARIITTLIKTTIKNNKINLKAIQEKIKQFLVLFPKITQILILNKLINDYI